MLRQELIKDIPKEEERKSDYYNSKFQDALDAAMKDAKRLLKEKATYLQILGLENQSVEEINAQLNDFLADIKQARHYAHPKNEALRNLLNEQENFLTRAKPMILKELSELRMNLIETTLETMFLNNETKPPANHIIKKLASYIVTGDPDPGPSLSELSIKELEQIQKYLNSMQMVLVFPSQDSKGFLSLRNFAADWMFSKNEPLHKQFDKLFEKIKEDVLYGKSKDSSNVKNLLSKEKIASLNALKTELTTIKKDISRGKYNTIQEIEKQITPFLSRVKVAAEKKHSGQLVGTFFKKSSKVATGANSVLAKINFVPVMKATDFRGAAAPIDKILQRFGQAMPEPNTIFMTVRESTKPGLLTVDIFRTGEDGKLDRSSKIGKYLYGIKKNGDWMVFEEKEAGRVQSAVAEGLVPVNAEWAAKNQSTMHSILLNTSRTYMNPFPDRVKENSAVNFVKALEPFSSVPIQPPGEKSPRMGKK